MPLMGILQRQKKADFYEFQANLVYKVPGQSYIVNPCLTRQQQNKTSHHNPLFKQNAECGLQGGGLVGKVLAVQAWRPEFNPQH